MTRFAVWPMTCLRTVAIVLPLILGISACGGGGGGSDGDGGGGAPGQPDAAITTQPASQSVAADSTATFTVVATDATGYQWQLSTDGGATFDDVNGATASSYTITVTLANSGARYRVVVSGAGNSVTSSAVMLTVTSAAGIPPDPVTVAPPVDPTVATDILATTAFLYTGANPIQTGVAADTITAQRVAVLRGKVLNRDDSVLSGVKVSVLDHPELGQTVSRDDGMFDLAVNGGGQLTVQYEKVGFLATQRAVSAPWRDYAWLPDVIMIPLDSAVTTIVLSADTLQVARGSAVTDTDGTRQATVLIPAGTTASMVLANGSTLPLTTLNMRATEFTVGANGPKAMPASLPPSSGYTYAAEFSVDEAIAAGATEVRFSQALPVYVENFLGFPVGGAVPAGYYDRQKGQWIASENGRVIEVLSITGSLADLDTNGDAAVDDAPTLAALGVTDDERTRLAQLYTAGQTLWRVPVTHFTPWDLNWPFGPPSDAVPPPARKSNNPSVNNPNEECGSVIGCEDQTLGESVAVSGTPFKMHYQSERTPGRNDLTIPLSGTTIPGSVKRIEMEVSVAGNQYVQSFAPAPNLSYAIAWDGKDAYGRILHDTQLVSVRIGYVYPGVYMLPTQKADSAEYEALFGHFSYFGAPATGNQQRLEVTLWREYETRLSRWDNRSLGLAGWSMNVQHVYDPASQTLLLGNGKRRRAEALSSSIISTVAGNGTAGFAGDNGPSTAAQLGAPTDIAVGPDGSLYIADPENHRIRRVDPDGIITTVAGNGDSVFGGDGGPALAAGLEYPYKVAVGLDGSLYIADSGARRIRRVGLDGIINTIAGNGADAFSGNGGPAVSTGLTYPHDIAVGPDGSLYIVNGFEDQIHRVGPDGIVSSVAGIWDSQGYSGDGGLATKAQLWRPSGIDVGSDGSLYIADAVNQRIRRVGPDGIITTFAGNGEFGFSGDGGLATAAQIASQVQYTPLGVAVGADGSLHIAEPENARIRSVGPDGIITTIAGNGIYGFSGDGGPATAAKLGATAGVAVGPDGVLYIADNDNNRIRRIAPLFPDYSTSDVLLASEDGREVYVFNGSRHLKTLDAFTGALRYQFDYSTDGYLTSITDGSGNVTSIERIGAMPTAIVAPGGQSTTLTVDANGWLMGVANPEGEAHAMTYSAEGLLQTFTDARNNIHTFTYDALGRLTKDENPAGGSTTLARTEQDNGYTVTTTSKLGRTHVYQVEQLSTGTVRRTVTAASGATTVTLLNTDGSEQTTGPDGTITTVTYGPDPRFGMVAPVVSKLVETTPGGRTRTVTTTRTATLTDPNNLLSLTHLTDTITDNGAVSTRVYDYDGTTRTLTHTTAAGRSRSVTLDELGRMTQAQALGLDPISFSYDSLGLLSAISEGGRTTDYTYNAANELTGLSDPLGRTLGLSYDNAGRVLTATLPGARTVTFAYDAAGNTSAVTPPGRSAHNFDYTLIDQTASYTPPSLGGGSTATQYSYNDDRALTTVTRPDGQLVDISYDVAGRTSALAIARGSIGYSYNDTTDQLTGISAPGGLGLGYSYDGDLLTGVAWSGAVAGSTAYTYNNDLRVTAESVNAANSVSFGYDPDGLLTTAGSLAIAYDADNGLRTGSTLGSVTDSLTYTALGEPATYSASYTSTGIYSAVYTRDALGRISQKVETIGGTASTYGYGYDTAGRLTAVTKDAVSAGAYSYDANGNRTASNGVSASYDAQDRLTSYGSASYSYTANGELLSKTVSAQTTSYQYDALGNLLQVTLPSGTAIDYLVDGENRRIGKKVNGTLTQGFLYQGALRPIAELDGSNAVVSRFVYATHANVPDYLIKGGVTYRIITDQVGSPRLVVNVANGAVAQRIDYDAFGQVLSDTNPGFQPFGFAGGLYDSDTKLVRFGARDYDAETGRWTAKDPIAFDGGDANLYAYVANDPVNFIDSDGLEGVRVGDTLYTNSHTVTVVGEPNASSGVRTDLPLGTPVTWLGYDPATGFDRVRFTSPSGGQCQVGYVLRQGGDTWRNLTPNPRAASSQPYSGPSLPFGHAYPSHGAGTKG